MLKFMPIFVTIMNIIKAFMPKDHDNAEDVNIWLYLLRIEHDILSRTLGILDAYQPSDQILKMISDIKGTLERNEKITNELVS
jgi:hypothetical protein